MKTIINYLLLVLVLTVVTSLIIEPLTTANFCAGLTLMCISSLSFLILNKDKNV
jgi:hypothetical protein